MNALYGLKNNINKRLNLTKSWFDRNEKYLMVSFFVLGFIFDNLTLNRVDQVFDNSVFLFYLLLTTVCIFLLARNQARKNPNLKLQRILPLITQFSFGNLFSGYVIFYTKSATWEVSWIFLLVLIFFFLGNEKLKKKYEKIDFQLNLLFIAVFSFLVFFVPVVLKKMGVGIFLLSGMLSVLIVYLLMLVISRYFQADKKKRKRKITLHMLGVFLVFNLLYFFNIIPPIPLSMKEIGIYDYVGKDIQGEYVFQKFDLPWYSVGNRFIKIKPNDSVYLYASVFAPTDLNTFIFHVWQKYNSTNKEWETIDKISYSIKGGRNQGYRGYSLVSGVDKGKWRVSVETKEGLVVGRVSFEVI
ncbi:MAG: DUF2914 domain-containing protein [Patescibacteria group bacterium]